MRDAGDLGHATYVPLFKSIENPTPGENPTGTADFRDSVDAGSLLAMDAKAEGAADGGGVAMLPSSRFCCESKAALNEPL